MGLGLVGGEGGGVPPALDQYDGVPLLAGNVIVILQTPVLPPDGSLEAAVPEGFAVPMSDEPEEGFLFPQIFGAAWGEPYDKA